MRIDLGEMALLDETHFETGSIEKTFEISPLQVCHFEMILRDKGFGCVECACLVTPEEEHPL